jgi:hypothetical protein
VADIPPISSSIAKPPPSCPCNRHWRRPLSWPCGVAGRAEYTKSTLKSGCLTSIADGQDKAYPSKMKSDKYTFTEKKDSMIAWHYTTGEKYELIKKSGLLLPADIGVSPPERPILWFSTHPRFEPTALKPLANAQGIIRMLSLEELRDMAGGLVRFGCPVGRLKFGETLRKEAKMQSIVWRGLAKRAAKVKASQSDWWGHVGSMPLTEVTVEVMNDQKTWLPEGV